MSPQTFAQLKQQLPQLQFDPQQDALVEDIPLCRDYLDFYQLSVPAGVRHVMGYFEAQDVSGGAQGSNSAQEYRIATHYFLPQQPQGTVFVVHGYFDHAGLYGHLIRYLLAKNYAVVAFDLPGHGLSSGEQVSIESFHHYVSVFSQLLERAQALPQPFHAVGQSTGGAIVLSYLLHQQSQPVALQQVALLAPLIRPTHWLKIKLSHKLLHRFRSQVGRSFRSNSKNTTFTEFISQRDPLQARFISVEWVGAMKQWVHEFAALPACSKSLAIVQGDQDETVDWQFNTRAIQEKFPNSSLQMISGANHHLVNEIEGLRAEAFDKMGF